MRKGASAKDSIEVFLAMRTEIYVANKRKLKAFFRCCWKSSMRLWKAKRKHENFVWVVTTAALWFADSQSRSACEKYPRNQKPTGVDLIESRDSKWHRSNLFLMTFIRFIRFWFLWLDTMRERFPFLELDGQLLRTKQNENLHRIL